MKFKKEIVLLTVALILFVSSSILYSYHTADSPSQTRYAFGLEETASASLPFSYQTLALSAIGFGVLLLVVAAFSYKKAVNN